MAQISGIPLAVAPGQLGQMMVRTGVLPENIMRPGQNLTLLVMQSAKAGEKTQVQIAGKTLEAILPGNVGAGQQIQVKVTQLDSQGIQLRMVDMRQSPQRTFSLNEKTAEQISLLSSRQGGKVSIQVSPDGQTVSINGKQFQPGQLGISGALMPGRWQAMFQKMPQGAQLIPIPGDPESRMRSIAGQAILSKDPSLIQAGIELGEALREADKTYDESGASQIGPAWMQMPDGTPISIGQKPKQDPETGIHTAQFDLHGSTIGSVSFTFVYSDAGLSISIGATGQSKGQIQEQQSDLAHRLRVLTGKPVYISTSTDHKPQRPPEGYEYYG